ncbi:toxic anion resistance protein [Vibrio mexicanus]|uniref:toxic anion resistance protein n=1 Tax=Vibrio mexicanus TaxID=1004326 RepID=UPI00063CEC3E|nr:toxic anion resistance protein [Vibrio mexicanus]
MVKTFHNNKSIKKASIDPVSPQAKGKENKQSVKKFTHVEPTVNVETTVETEQYVERNKTGKGSVKKSPSVLFTNKISTIQSDIVEVDPNIKASIDRVSAREFRDIELDNSEYILVNNIYQTIDFDDFGSQLEFGNQESRRFQDIQGFLSDYAKIGKVDRILELGQSIIHLAKSINIDVFNPNKLGTKISRFLGSHQDKVRKIKFEFDSASDRIDARINRVFDNTSEIQRTLSEFQSLKTELQGLHRGIQLKMVALSMKIDSEVSQRNSMKEGNNTVFDDSFNEHKRRWERKNQTLFSLNQSVSLTFPQIDLYTSNLVASFERLEEIKVNIIQVWKQQFLTVIAVDESNDSILYYELSDIQDNLIRNIEGLR